MAQKSSFLLAILFVVNPVMLLFFQNCSVMPQATSTTPSKAEKSATTKPKDSVTYNFNKSL